MVYRRRFRRLLFLATLCLTTVVVVEVLLLPAIRSARQEPPREDLPSHLARPKTEEGFIKSPSLREQLLKNHNRTDEVVSHFLIEVQIEEDQHADENPDPRASGTDLTRDDSARQGVIEESETFRYSVKNTLPLLSTSTQTSESTHYLKNPTNDEVKPRTRLADVDKNPSSQQLKVESDVKYWFFKNGTIWPTTPAKGSLGVKRKIWPREAPHSDRIVDQLMHIPEDYDPSRGKTVVLTNDLGGWNVPLGAEVFQKCPVKACTLSAGSAATADALLFRNTIDMKDLQKRDSQKWILYMLESPIYTSIHSMKAKSLIDWTATYRMDSDIVAPYEKWVYYDENIKTLEANRQVNFAAGKTAQVAWFVSNCQTSNQRLQYAQKLQKYISVDIYGLCGNLTCPRRSSHCQDLLNTKYKFYLSFENSNCIDYITEKFFVTGLGNNVLPIVMGAEKSHYVRSAPHNSFIHVDDFDSPKQLAKYLHLLDKNDTLYNQYFQWKGTGELINTYFWCRLCTMLHDSGSGSSGKYADIEEWWHENTCRPNSWRLEDGGEDLAY